MWKPQEISQKDVGQVNSHGAVLRSRPNQAVKIAVIISCWSNIERLLTEIIAYSVVAEGWLAAELLFEIRKLKPKLDQVVKSIERNLPAELREKALAVLDSNELNSMGKARDRLAHGVFITLNKYPDGVVEQRGYGDDEHWYLYTDQGLTELLAHFEKKLNEMSSLWLTIAASGPARYETGRVIFPHQTWGAAPQIHPMPLISDNQPQPSPSPDQSKPQEPNS